MHIVTRDIPSPALTGDNIDDIKNCIEDCRGHKFCSRPTTAPLPTRLIDCSNPEMPRVITTAKAMSSESTPYATLSYVWGEDQPYRTTVDNIELYHSAIDPHTIPRTIRDAIAVTSSLGLRYLWVDSFCIMQDSDEDKDREIKKMRLYYSNTYITIVAANTKCVSSCFLRYVARRSNSTVNLPFPISPTAVGTMSLVVNPGMPDRSQYSAVDSRAWCLEERILSPRRLIFSEHALRYECQMMCCDINGSSVGLENDGSVSEHLQLPQLPIGYETTDVVAPTSLWFHLLSEYTGRELTKEKDRLVAFAGVAEHFELVWKEYGVDAQYVAGLWTHQLNTLEALLWQVTSDANPLPESYRAPSWSWAAVHGRVTTYSRYPLEEYDVTYTVKRCTVTLKRESNQYGEVTAGLLILSCRTAGWYGWAVSHQPYIRPLALPQSTDGSFSVGLIQDSLEFIVGPRVTPEVPFLVAVLGKRRLGGWIGLALVSAAGKVLDDVEVVQYRRIGVVEINSGTHVELESERMLYIV